MQVAYPFDFDEVLTFPMEEIEASMKALYDRNLFPHYDTFEAFFEVFWDRFGTGRLVHGITCDSDCPEEFFIPFDDEVFWNLVLTAFIEPHSTNLHTQVLFLCYCPLFNTDFEICPIHDLLDVAIIETKDSSLVVRSIPLLLNISAYINSGYRLNDDSTDEIKEAQVYERKISSIIRHCETVDVQYLPQCFDLLTTFIVTKVDTSLIAKLISIVLGHFERDSASMSSVLRMHELCPFVFMFFKSIETFEDIFLSYLDSIREKVFDLPNTVVLALIKLLNGQFQCLAYPDLVNNLNVALSVVKDSFQGTVDGLPPVNRARFDAWLAEM
ncbi:hypothetical protein PCE1_003164 [Barthelona sp. PCE]